MAEVKEAGKAAGGAGELAAHPAKWARSAPAAGRGSGHAQAERQLAGRLVEGQHGRLGVIGGRAGRDGQSGGQGLEFQGVAVGRRQSADGAPAWRWPTRLSGRL